MSKITGTIRTMEAKQVLTDIFKRRGISPGLYGFRKSTCAVLVGSRTVVIPLPPGLSYYELKNLTERVERICNDIDRARAHVGQVDLEDAIAGAPA